MGPTRQDLIDRYRRLGDDELLELVRTGGLTELAREVAAAEIAHRNLDPAPAEPGPPAPAFVAAAPAAAVVPRRIGPRFPAL